MLFRLCHHQEYSNYKTTIHSLSLTCSSPVLLNGIRLSLAPGSQVSVTIRLSSVLSSKVVLDKGKLSNDDVGEDEAKVVMFDEEFPLVPDLLHHVEVEVCGRGSTGALGFRSDTQTQKTRSVFSSFLGGGGSRGVARDRQQVVFTISEDQGQIHELYYKQLPSSPKPPAFHWLKKK